MSFFSPLLNAAPGAIAQGMLWGIMAIGGLRGRDIHPPFVLPQASKWRYCMTRCMALP